MRSAALTPPELPEADGVGTADIFAAQGSDPDLLAELYDLEHDGQTADHGFYREMVRRHRGGVLDLGSGSGRLFRPFVEGGARRIVGLDASAALLRRAERRISDDALLREAAAAGRIRMLLGDVGSLPVHGRFALVVAAGLVPHLGGPAEALRMLQRAAAHLAANGVLVLDDLGPASLPQRDLPLSVDWRRRWRGGEAIRRSQIERQECVDGVRIAYSTITDAVRPDGTIARLPASYRLWYPSLYGLTRLVEEAGLVVEARFGSHDLDRLDARSERRIVVARIGGPARRRADP